MTRGNGSKRVFLLGPSHHVYLPNAALSQCTTYATPLGNLKIDSESNRPSSTQVLMDSDRGAQVERQLYDHVGF